MNRLKELRKEKKLTQEELSKDLYKHGLLIGSDTIDDYERGVCKIENDNFWQKVADYFGVTLAYLKGDSKIPNEDYVIDLQDVLHENFELKKEINFLTDENQRLNDDLCESNTILEEFRRMLHIDD